MFKLYNKFLGINMDDIAETSDYHTLNDWYVRLSGKIAELNERENDETTRKILSNAKAFLRQIKKQRTCVYREKLLANGYIPETKEDVEARSLVKCFFEVASQRLDKDKYEEIYLEARDMAIKLRNESVEERDRLMDED